MRQAAAAAGSRRRAPRNRGLVAANREAHHSTTRTRRARPPASRRCGQARRRRSGVRGGRARASAFDRGSIRRLARAGAAAPSQNLNSSGIRRGALTGSRPCPARRVGGGVFQEDLCRLDGVDGVPRERPIGRLVWRRRVHDIYSSAPGASQLSCSGLQISRA